MKKLLLFFTLFAILGGSLFFFFYPIAQFTDEKLRNETFTAHQLQTLTKVDIEFITKTIVENHPGTHNSLDPKFNQTLNLANHEALASINKVKTLKDYNEVLQKYATHFNDAHLNISTNIKLSKAPVDFYKARSYGLKEFMPNVIWITLPTFDPNPQALSELNKIITLLPSYRHHKLIIFDLRGNAGGDAYWGTKILGALFGNDYAHEKINVMDQNVYVDWRVSTDNLAYLSELINQLKKQFGSNSKEAMQRQKLYDRMFAALQKKIPLCSERDETNTLASKNNQNRCHAKIIAIIDSQCFSACLRFIDELKSLNHPVELWGQRTGADSLYIQARTVVLPSKLGHLSVPMTVYRNRQRKNNEPYYPDVEFVGNIKDTKVVEQWVKKELNV